MTYELLSGRRPFEDADPQALVRLQLTARPTPLGQLLPGLKPAINRVVQRMLASEPQQRFVDLAAAPAALREAVQEG